MVYQLTDSSYNENLFNDLSLNHVEIMNKEFYSCKFTNCDLSEVVFQNSIFEDCLFDNCNLSLTNFRNSRLQKVEFEECKITGVNYGLCERYMIDINFNQCYLQNCTFFGLNLNKNKFLCSRLIECDFVETELKYSEFCHSDLSGTTFHNCNLEYSSFKDATNYNIPPIYNKLKKATFTLPDVIGLLTCFGLNIE